MKAVESRMAFIIDNFSNSAYTKSIVLRKIDGDSRIRNGSSAQIVIVSRDRPWDAVDEVHGSTTENVCDLIEEIDNCACIQQNVLQYFESLVQARPLEITIPCA
jgi:hypothetical protein